MADWKDILDIKPDYSIYQDKIKAIGGDFRVILGKHKNNSLGMILADPPWPYKDDKYRTNKLLSYPTLSLEEMQEFFILAERKLKKKRNFWVWSDWMNVPRVIRMGRKAGLKYFALCVAKRRKLGLGMHVRKHVYFLVGLCKEKPIVKGHLTEYLGEFTFVGSKKPEQIVQMLLNHSLVKGEKWLEPFPATHIELSSRKAREKTKEYLRSQYDR